EPGPGSREGLQALADTGVRLGIVSNADGMMGPRLAQLELCQVGPGIGVDIECVVDSGNVGVMKPDPRIFEAALDLLGLDADQVWYVGDMPAIDVVGARRADRDVVLRREVLTRFGPTRRGRGPAGRVGGRLPRQPGE